MPRELTDGEGIRWTCVQAYAGLTGEGNEEAARVEGREDLYEVVCTPSGAAQTVRLKLPSDWEEKLSDEQLLEQIDGERD